MSSGIVSNVSESVLFILTYIHECNHLTSAEKKSSTYTVCWKKNLQLIQPYIFKPFLKNIHIRNRMRRNSSENLFLALLALIPHPAWTLLSLWYDLHQKSLKLHLVKIWYSNFSDETLKITLVKTSTYTVYKAIRI